jgi:hypothetical protein
MFIIQPVLEGYIPEIHGHLVGVVLKEQVGVGVHARFDKLSIAASVIVVDFSFSI